MTTNNNKEEESQSKEVAALVASMADRKRADLDILRAFLLQQQPQKQTQSSQAPSNVSTTRMQPQTNGAATTNSVVTSQKNASKATFTPTRTRSSRHWVRCMALDLPMMLLFGGLAIAFVMRTLWTDYYRPLMDRARRTDRDLLDEYTYYERECTAEDVTHMTFNFTNTAGNTKNTTTMTTTSTSTITVEESLDSLLRHGAVLIPNLLTPTTVAQLRRYLQHKNSIVTDEEAIPMSQGYQRLSYGLEATEDPAIIQALAEITSHPLLPLLLQQVVGDSDPALTEITAITSFVGAEDQVIHSDTKSDGYAAQFARTYTHTYSLFIPVQPVTSRMGVTQLCPGTHYCTNDMQEICWEEMFGINQAYDDEIWKAGDGALLNQQVWHGGSRHTDPKSPERILFILSFAARPQLGNDTRQLARGTYFHMKWNMWGHTWSDIASDSAISMSWPFNILRSLAIWKPRSKHWGYDLLLSAALRAANGQQGMEVDDLNTFIELKMNGLFHFPKWLQGTFDPNAPDPWRLYIQETLDKTFEFLQIANGVFVGGYLLVALLVTIATTFSSTNIRGTTFRLGSVLKHLVVTHGTIALLTWATLKRVQTSEWGSNILSGKTLMRPFPTDSEFTSERWEDDPTQPVGPTTLPERMDILFGTRYDAKYLGSYNRWLDYHPGNLVFSAAVAPRAHLYPVYQGLEDPIFLQTLMDDVVEEVAEKTNNGRFLQQDHLSGDWVVLSALESLEKVRMALVTESNALFKDIHQEINYLLADYRFGLLRGTALALESTLYLHEIRQQLFGSLLSIYPTAISNNKPLRIDDDSTPGDQEKRAILRPMRPLSKKLKPMSTFQSVISRPGTPSVSSSTTKLPTSSQQQQQQQQQQITVGTPVVVYMSFTSSWMKGTVVEVVTPNQSFDISYDDSQDGAPAAAFEENVSIRRIRKPVMLEEGVRVRMLLEDAPYEGTISMVYPTGSVDILFDNDEFITDVYAEDYEFIYPAFF